MRKGWRRDNLPVGHAPVGVLHVVAVAVIGPVLARLAGEVHLQEEEV